MSWPTSHRVSQQSWQALRVVPSSAAQSTYVDFGWCQSIDVHGLLASAIFLNRDPLEERVVGVWKGDLMSVDDDRELVSGPLGFQLKTPVAMRLQIYTTFTNTATTFYTHRNYCTVHRIADVRPVVLSHSPCGHSRPSAHHDVAMYRNSPRSLRA